MNYTNDLIKETSPYLLQHAHNPVRWKPWTSTTIDDAKASGRLIVVSIGYSACHWCHVMEHESFENEEVASIMNTHYTSIKVDREERPDVDNIYMTAVQLMTGQGGWPLNVITLPDGRPVWGGTYFKKKDWTNALLQIAQLYKESPDKLEEYADNLAKGMQQADVITPNTSSPDFSNEVLENAIAQWSRQWDTRQGGLNRAPKFMMPTNYRFLLYYAHVHKDEEILDYVNATLESIAYGGINDHVGGGFARYSTDMKWHIPHFEKMLYDNAQLVTLYAEAYTKTKNSLYKEVVYDTLQYIEREMTTIEGAFYSAQDADSLTKENNLEEGAFYTWKIEELKSLLGKDFSLFQEYYNINNYGYWEQDTYVLIRQDADEQFAKNNGISIAQLNSKKREWKKALLRFRESERAKPRLDDKILTAWNALMLKGYVDAYRAFNESRFLTIAEKNAQFIHTHLINKDGSLYRTYKNGQSNINGYLEDFAALIEAYIHLYESTARKKWLTTAKKLMDYTLEHYRDDERILFYFTSNLDPKLASRPVEYYDNVIPSSNSIMAHNLYRLSIYYTDTVYKEVATQMLHHLTKQFKQSPTSFSNWMSLMLHYTQNFYEIIIVGEKAKQLMMELNTYYIPNAIKAYTTIPNEEALLKNRYQAGKTYIYICKNNSCHRPVETVNEALEQLEI